MANPVWKITCQVFRQKGSEPAHYEPFVMEADPDEYILDVVERIWAFHDRSLVFRHACHHSTCGACGMRINGLEKLTCITLVRDVTEDGGTVKIEPLRNFPVVSDLVVDMGAFYRRMEMVGHRPVLPVSEAGVVEKSRRSKNQESEQELLRLADCIECGLCISACPIAVTDPDYLGPAVLAGAQQNGLDRSPHLLETVDHAEGVWRCHSVYECTAVCPSYVEPAWRIMDLRKQVVKARIKRLFRPERKTQYE
jgi:succinate dehydrogenase / fumarate reductase iron-sulfur subunit